MNKDKKYDVAIVGYGPTGVTLANLLIKLKLNVLVIEREEAILQLPRAIRFDAECMRVFQSIGITEQLLKQVAPGPGMKFQDAKGKEMFRWERPIEVGLHQWSSAYRVHQPDLEAVLRHQIQDHELLDLKLGHEVYKVEEHADDCTIYFEGIAQETLHQATARYVIGCDGAHSIVRRLINTTYDDLGLSSQWLVVDFILTDEQKDLGDYSIQFCDPKRPISYIKGTGQRRRFEIMVMPEDNPKQLASTASIWNLLEQYIKPADAQIERSAIYTFDALLAKRYCRRRLIIAGDAAHQTPPFMGQGMAAGIHDAANLAWKLHQAIVHQHDHLIKSYHTERHAHVKEFIQGAVQFGNIIQNYSQDAEYQQQLDRLTQFRTPTPRLGYGFYQSRDDIGGQLSPQFILQDGELSDDVVGYHFVLFIKPVFYRLVHELNLHLIENLKIIITDCLESMAWIQENQAIAILVRPDRYVFGQAKSAETLEQLIKSASLNNLVAQ